DRERLDSLVEEAGALTHIGDKRTADALYLKALQYPFYLASDPVIEKELRELYIRAGRGIIDLRRHNLSLLKELVFVPSTNADLQPYLQAAIKEASGP
ncbi:MAG TPA: hypothetical protein VFJ58_25430, partial [Armatimonadota bacterium]|nr:hypothetical protein [Armatimonadota bacterium]